MRGGGVEVVVCYWDGACEEVGVEGGCECCIGAAEMDGGEITWW